MTADEAVVGNDRVVVLSHGFWTRALGGDRSVIGRPIQLDSVPYVVVGVMPPSFEFPTSTNVEVWTPLAFDPKDLHGRLLVLHGMIDDNVHMQNSVQFIDALQRAGKEFELMFYPQSRHGIASPHYLRLQIEFIRRTMGVQK